MTTKRSLRELFRRYLCLLAGLFTVALGIAFSIRGDLGTSPVSSPPYVVSLFTPLTVGTLTILLHCLFILLQILLLRKNYDPVQLSQLAVAFVFGPLTDLCLWLTRGLVPNAYWQQWVLCAIGILLVAVGVSLEVTADVVMLAGEGLTLALSRVTPLKFSQAKVVMDVSLVTAACILSFVFLHSLQGVREGTLAAAVFVGLITKPVSRVLVPLGQTWFAAGQ